MDLEGVDHEASITSDRNAIMYGIDQRRPSKQKGVSAMQLIKELGVQSLLTTQTTVLT